MMEAETQEGSISKIVGFDDTGLIPDIWLRKAGYDLAGYIVSVGGKTGDRLVDAKMDSYRTLAAIGEPTITLKAKWVAKTYEVHYDLNGSTNHPTIPAALSPMTKGSDGTALRWWSTGLVPSTVPTRPGYRFLNWKLSDRGGMRVSLEGQSPVLASTEYSTLALDPVTKIDHGTITLQAQWEEGGDVTIDYRTLNTKAPDDPNPGGKLDNDQTTKVESISPATGTAVGATASPDPGYHLVGWYRTMEYIGSPLTATPLPSLNRTYVLARVPAGKNGLNVTASYIAVFTEDSDITLHYDTATYSSKMANLAVQDKSKGGSVSPTSQDDIAPVTGKPSSTAQENPGYNFRGWYAYNEMPEFHYLSDEAAIKLEANREFVPTYLEGEAFSDDTRYIAVFQEQEDVTMEYRVMSLDNGGTKQYMDVSGGGQRELSSAGGSITLGADTTPQAKYSAQVAPATGTAQQVSATAAAGYTFMGWYKSSDLGDTDKIEIEKIISISKDENGDILSTFSPQKDGEMYVSGSYVAVFQEDPDVSIDYLVETYTSGGMKHTSIGGSVQVTGSLGETNETLAPVSEDAIGVTAKEQPGYTFMGWYVHSEGENFNYLTSESKLSVDADNDGKDDFAYVPLRKQDAAMGLNVTAKYVAVFQENGDVTIKYGMIVLNNDGTEPNTGGGGSFRFSSDTDWENSEKVDTLAPTSGTAKQVVALADPGYRFCGWYRLSELKSEGNRIEDVASISEGDGEGDRETFIPKRVGGIYTSDDYVAIFAEKEAVKISYRTENRKVDVEDSNAGGSISGLLDPEPQYHPPVTGGAGMPTAIPDPALVLSTYSESVRPVTGTASGSSVTAVADGYLFMGWVEERTDENYSNPSYLATTPEFEAPKPVPLDGSYPVYEEGKTYVALFANQLNTSLNLVVNPADKQTYGEPVILKASLAPSALPYENSATIIFYFWDSSGNGNAGAWVELEASQVTATGKAGDFTATAEISYTPKEKGSLKYRAAFAGDNFHKACSDVEIPYEIVPSSSASIVVNIAERKVYDGLPYEAAAVTPSYPIWEETGERIYSVMYTGTSSDGMGYASTMPPTKVGSYKVTATISNPNYIATAASKDFAIDPRPLTLEMTVAINKALANIPVMPNEPANPVAEYRDDAVLTVQLTNTVGTELPPGIVKFYVDYLEDGLARKLLAEASVAGNAEDGYFASTGAWLGILAGDHDIYAEYLAAQGDNYSGGSTSKDHYSVNKVDQVGFAFEGDAKASVIYKDPAFVVKAAGGDSTGEITYKLDSGGEYVDFDAVTNTVTKIKGAGTVVIEAVHHGDSNFNDATTTITIQIAKAKNVLSPIVDETRFGESIELEKWFDASFGGQNESGGDLSYTSYSGRGDTSYGPSDVPPTSIGDYTVTITSTGTNNYEETAKQVEFSITPCDCHMEGIDFPDDKIAIAYYKYEAGTGISSEVAFVACDNHDELFEVAYAMPAWPGAKLVTEDSTTRLVVNDAAVGTRVPVTVTYVHKDTIGNGDVQGSKTAYFEVVKGEKPPSRPDPEDSASPSNPEPGDPQMPGPADPGEGFDDIGSYNKNTGGDMAAELPIDEIMDRNPDAELLVKAVVMEDGQEKTIILEKGVDYYIEDGELVFAKEFLKKLPAGMDTDVEISLDKPGSSKSHYRVRAKKGKPIIEILEDPIVPPTVQITVSDDTKYLESFLITQEDQKEIENGWDVEVKLVLSDLKIQEDADIISDRAQDAGERTVGLLIDLELLKKVGDQPEESVKELSNFITIECELPAELYAPGRQYWVAMVHHPLAGEAEFRWIPVTLFEKNGGIWFRFETDRFSTVAIMYKDSSIVPINPPNPAGPTNPTTPPTDPAGPTLLGDESSGTNSRSGDDGSSGIDAGDPDGSSGGGGTGVMGNVAPTLPAAGTGGDDTEEPTPVQFPYQRRNAAESENGLTESSEPVTESGDDIIGLTPLDIDRNVPDMEGETEPVAELTPTQLPILQWMLNGLLGLFAIAGAAMIFSSGARVGILSAIQGAMGYLPKTAPYAQVAMSAVGGAGFVAANPSEAMVEAVMDECWIRISGTDIDYPIGMDGEMEEHLYAHLAGDTARDGIYLDNRCIHGVDSPFLLFYGNNNGDGSMFAALNDYLEEGFLEEHPVVHIAKAYETLKPYKIIHVLISNGIFDLVNNELPEVIEYLAEQEIHLPKGTTKIAALSTWTNSGKRNERLIVLAVR